MNTINISNVYFIKSITKSSERPKLPLPEIAVIGRSNVGKSSLINAVFNKKKLAKTSSTPGKTRLINYFSVDNKCYFVDLPGYGYAKGIKKVNESWQKMMNDYLINNESLKIVLLLIDSRRGILPIDEIMIDWLNHYKINWILVLTKTDKLSNNELKNINVKITGELIDIKIINHSAKTKKGNNELLNLLNYTVSNEK